MRKDDTPFKAVGDATTAAKKAGYKEGEFKTMQVGEGFGYTPLVEKTPTPSLADAKGEEGKAPTATKEVAPDVKENFSPARVLDVPAHLKDPNFSYRWCSKNKPGRIQQLLSEGWVQDDELAKKIHRPSMKDGASLDSTTQVRELILMKLPIAMKEARDNFYAGQSTVNEDAGKSLDTELSGVESSAYGEVKKSGVTPV